MKKVIPQIMYLSLYDDREVCMAAPKTFVVIPKKSVDEDPELKEKILKIFENYVTPSGKKVKF